MRPPPPGDVASWLRQPGGNVSVENLLTLCQHERVAAGAEAERLAQQTVTDEHRHPRRDHPQPGVSIGIVDRENPGDRAGDRRARGAGSVTHALRAQAAVPERAEAGTGPE